MAPGPDDPTSDGADEALGAPVTELQGLVLPVDERFARKLRNRIDRRLLTGIFIDLAWTAPLMVLLELLSAPFALFSRKRP